MTVVEQSALQRTGCGKAARPVLQRGLPHKGQVYSTIRSNGFIGTVQKSLTYVSSYFIMKKQSCCQMLTGGADSGCERRCL